MAKAADRPKWSSRVAPIHRIGGGTPPPETDNWKDEATATEHRRKRLQRKQRNAREARDKGVLPGSK